MSPSTTEAQYIQNLITNITFASLNLSDVVNAQALNQPPPSASPGTGGLPPQFGARFFVPPPLGETRFVKEEVVLQIPSGITLAQLTKRGPRGIAYDPMSSYPIATEPPQTGESPAAGLNLSAPAPRTAARPQSGAPDQAPKAAVDRGVLGPE